jgi:hypothetical protein
MSTSSITRSLPSIPNVLIKLESALFAFGALSVYIQRGGSGWLFVLLILAPDLSALGYLRGVGLGSVTYNAVHTYLAPALLALVSTLVGWPVGIDVALIWCIHISADRALGFGLKYPTAFNDTHLNRI